MAALPLLRQSRGSHVAVASVAAFAPLLKRPAYSASKHALVGFYNTLRAEERPHGVHVLVVYPSYVATNPGNTAVTDHTVRPGAASDGLDPMSPEAAAVRLLRALDARKERLLLGRVAWLSWWVNALAPRLYERLMVRSIGGDNRQDGQ